MYYDELGRPRFDPQGYRTAAEQAAEQAAETRRLHRDLSRAPESGGPGNPEIEQSLAASRQWRMQKQARRIRAARDAERERDLAEYEREREAERELEAYQERLAAEIRHQRYTDGPNPWVSPGDPGYVSPELAQARRMSGDPDPYRRGPR